MTDVSVPWGDEQLGFSLPGDWTLQQRAEPVLKPAGSDWQQRLAMSLSQPTSGEPLGRLAQARRGGRVAIIVEDLTRHSPLPEILAVVLREIRHAGIRDEQIEIVFATGMHPPMSDEEQSDKLGDAAEGIARRCNPWEDPHQSVEVGSAGKLPVQIDRGVATADLRVIVSSVSPHLQAGFGGGYKMIVPGCASLETIRGLHHVDPGGRQAQRVGTGAADNPMRAAIDDAGRLLDAHQGRTFAVQYLLDGANLATVVSAGEPVSTQRMMAKQCSLSCGVLVQSPADVLITCAHPRDHDLWQSFKSIANTCWALKPNGVLICLTRCVAGLGGMNVPPWPLSATWTRRVLRAIGPDGLSSLVERLLPRLAGDAAFFIRMATGMLYRNPIYLVSPSLHEAGAKFPGLRVFATPEEAVTAARQFLGDGPQRVVVFPAGGITYPIPPGSAAREQTRRAEQEA